MEVQYFTSISIRPGKNYLAQVVGMCFSETGEDPDRFFLSKFHFVYKKNHPILNMLAKS